MAIMSVVSAMFFPETAWRCPSPLVLGTDGVGLAGTLLGLAATVDRRVDRLRELVSLASNEVGSVSSRIARLVASLARLLVQDAPGFRARGWRYQQGRGGSRDRSHDERHHDDAHVSIVVCRHDATTQTEREASRDPRASLEERYGSHRGYVEAVRQATAELVRERFLLEEDAARLLKTAEASTVLR